MRAIFCAYDGSGHLNGPNVWLRLLLPALRTRGIDAQALFLLSGPPEQCPTLQALERAGVPCRAAPPMRTTEERVRWLVLSLMQMQPDVLVPNVVLPAYYAARWARAAGVPTVGVIHSDDPFHHALIERFVCGRPEDQLSALVCVSQSLEAQAHKQALLVSRRPQIARIPCGVPLPQAQAQPPAERFRMIYVGRLVDEQKRASDVARALVAATRAIPGAEAVMYGEGHARPAIEAMLADSDAPVRLGGALAPEAVQAAMLDAHALVLLSDYEGLPIALMEAMSCGVVPICSPMRSGIAELVTDDVNGMIAPDRAEGFVAKASQLRQDVALWQRMSAVARATIATNYSDQAATMRWAALLGELGRARSPGIISPPVRLDLPHYHDAFAREDQRGPYAVAEALRRARVALGELRRELPHMKLSR